MISKTENNNNNLNVPLIDPCKCAKFHFCNCINIGAPLHPPTPQVTHPVVVQIAEELGPWRSYIRFTSCV